MATASDPKAQELTAMIREIRERVRERYPEGQTKGLGVPLPNLLPLLHAKDAAEGKVASIGGVNPRPGGALNSLIQFVKRQISRSLGWFVRDQVEFNRSILTTVEATLEALNEVNRALVSFGSLREETTELKDIRVHWLRWREDWEKKLYQNEIHFLRSVADLRGAIDQRMLQSEANFRESTRLQHSEFSKSLDEAVDKAQQQLWADLEKVRLEYEALIHKELRVLRQKADAGKLPMQASPVLPSTSAASTFGEGFDYTRFADRFRGSEEYVRKNQLFYVPYFAGRKSVLDIGCGRGELLTLFREKGILATGIDLDEESVALCVHRELSAQSGDLFEYLPKQPNGLLDGVIASQVVEHLSPERVPEMIRLAAAALQPGGILALETPNPECLAIFATHFYLDPTHTRPLPPALLSFYMEEAGFGRIEVHRLSPASESMPVLNELPAGFREAFFGGLDYAIIGRKL